MTELVPLSERHIPAVRELVRDPETLRYTRVPEPPPPDFAEEWIARYERGREAGEREGFAIVEGDEFLGLALAPAIDAETREAELGYVVAPVARGRGVASEALRLLTDWAFGRGLERLELRISVGNGASRKVAQRCGYELEGTLRAAYFKQGRREDTEIWSRLAPGVGDGDFAG